jgi:regulator of sigma E protease
MSVLLVIGILVILIVGHELGHFIVAKLSGVKVDEFGVGYPPRLFSFGKIGETEYTLNWLPFGGFVRLFGEDGNQKGQHSFVGASHLKQAMILFAGVFANFILGWLLFSGGFMLGMPTAVDVDAPGAKLLISGVIANSPAEESGLVVGDEILSVTSTDGYGAENLSPSTVSDFIADHGGVDVTLTFLREGEVLQTTITPVHAVIEEESGRPALGIALTPISQTKLPVGKALVKGGKYAVGSLRTVTVGLYRIIRDAFQGGAKIENLVGPVGLVGVVDDAAGHGLGHILGLAGFISINLAIINLIPIPALDGGRLVFVAYEAISRRKVPHIVSGILNTVGFAAIIILMLAVTYNDILRLVT